MSRTILLLFSVGIGFTGTALRAAAIDCPRPSSISIQAWNLMSADAQGAACRAGETTSANPPAAYHKPSFWNLMFADDQATWYRLAPKTWAQMTDQERKDWYRILMRPSTTTAAANKPANWNTMDAAEQAQWLCRDDPYRATNRCKMIPPPSGVRTNATGIKPTGWNVMNASQQAYWLQHGTAAPSASPTLSTPPTTFTTRCGRACGEPWTAEDFAANQRELERLEREIAAANRQMNAIAYSSHRDQDL